MDTDVRLEQDAWGALEVPAAALWVEPLGIARHRLVRGGKLFEDAAEFGSGRIPGTKARVHRALAIDLRVVFLSHATPPVTPRLSNDHPTGE